MQGARTIYAYEISLPYVGINRIRFMGMFSIGSPWASDTPAYYFSINSTSYSLFQFFPVK